MGEELEICHKSQVEARPSWALCAWLYILADDGGTSDRSEMIKFLFFVVDYHKKDCSTIVISDRNSMNYVDFLPPLSLSLSPHFLRSAVITQM